jgi:cytochrome c biogenesis protein
MRALTRVKSFLTARSTVLLLILLVTAAMTAAAVIPQVGGISGDGAQAVQVEASRPSAVVALLGLDHVFSTWWFAAVAILFAISLGLSTFDQLGVARARTFHLPGERGDGTPCAIPRDEVCALLDREGYRKMAEGPGRARFVRLWPGYWGQFLLHLGMTVSVLFAVVYVLTEHRLLLRVVSGASVPVEPTPSSTRRGLLAWPMDLPSAVALLRVEPTFWPDDHVKDVASALVFTDARGRSEDFRIAVNDQRSYHGIVVYQRTTFGHAFTVRLEDEGSTARELSLAVPFPPRRDVASYASFPLEDRLLLKAKYYADAGRARIEPENPQLVLRLYDGDRLVEETSLVAGGTGRLGRWSVRLAAVEWWSDLLFEGSQGTAGIFTGFAILIVGAALTFFAVPREVVLRETPSGCTVAWRTTRFADFFVEERDRILSRCKGELAA